MAKFKRVVEPNNPNDVINRGESYWQLFAGDKLIVKLTVNEISNNRPELYDGIATREFGKDLIRAFKQRTSNTLKINVSSVTPVEFVIGV